MADVRVITDSASDLPVELAQKARVTIVPLEVRLGNLDPLMLRSTSGAEFWELAARSPDLPTTAAPSPGQFRDAFIDAKNDGADGIVCITISSELSATYQAACTGAEEVSSQIAVKMIDSRFATLGEGLIVLEAAKHANAGASLDEISVVTTETIARTQTFGTLDTLDSLKRGGRIGTAQAFVGSLLSIKPVIEVKNGVVEGESRQRTRTRSLRYLVEKVSSAGPIESLGIVHAAAEDIDEFVTMIGQVFPIDLLTITFIGPVIGAHTGPGTIGVCFIRSALTT